MVLRFSSSTVAADMLNHSIWSLNQLSTYHCKCGKNREIYKPVLCFSHVSQQLLQQNDVTIVFTHVLMDYQDIKHE